ncbi:oxidoreductase [Paraliomyxa miuraensis]|uniref:oxidoreductase n=1 Tax=Paraliomyxa miuraensis TaxID=376150 RepID=UPI002255125B|nr:oxidoreductase [Paraliomyxa miuraensis]MCX4247485.1 oxidoreductase [Paraliomyxa miuraensis]
MSDPRWTADDIPDLSDRVVVVTGANSGLGFHTARILARQGAQVIMACRSEAKAREAADRIDDERPSGRVEPWALDLASLRSIEAFAKRLASQYEEIHALCNNAGVMALPYGKTEDGFEMQLGTNHLGHYALTGRLLPLLLAAEGSRVVTVSSLVHKMGRMRWDDLQSEHRYQKWPAYAQSKLANLLFTYELQRRLSAAKVETIAIASHPGYASTNLQAAGARMMGSSLRARVMEVANRVAAQSAEMGAMPSLYALTAEDVRGGDFVGPGGPMQMWGYPTKVEPASQAKDLEQAAQLWAVSQRLTGVRYDALSN